MRLRQILLYLLVLACFGCYSSPPDLVGTWSSGLGGALTTYHFRKDGTFMVENLYAGTHAVVEGTYSVEGGKLNMVPTKSDVQGDGPQADQIRSVIMQPSHVTMTLQSPGNFQLGKDSPPLMVYRMLPTP